MTPELIHPKVHFSDTGLLSVFDNLPFPVVRTFEIRGVKPNAVRGRHAHKTCDQIIRCVAGSCFMTTQPNDGSVRGWDLGVGVAVLVPRMHWIQLQDFSEDCVVTVLCSEEWKPPIDDWAEFLKESANLRSEK